MVHHPENGQLEGSTHSHAWRCGYQPRSIAFGILPFMSHTRFNAFAGGWVLRSAGLKGSKELARIVTAVRTPEHPVLLRSTPPRVLIPSSRDLAYLAEPPAIHLDPTEPSGAGYGTQ